MTARAYDSYMALHQEKVQTHDRCELVEVTDHVQALVTRSKMNSGLVIVYCPHTTAAVTINENAAPDMKYSDAPIDILAPTRPWL